MGVSQTNGGLAMYGDYWQGDYEGLHVGFYWDHLGFRKSRSCHPASSPNPRRQTPACSPASDVGAPA